jgi:hypothetical protein
MSKALKTSKLYTDGINGDDGSSSDQPLLDAFTQNNYSPAMLGGGMTFAGSIGPTTLLVPVIPSGGGGPATSQVGTKGGLLFNNTFDSTCSQGYINCVTAAEKTLSTLFTNSLTVSVQFTEALTKPTYNPDGTPQTLNSLSNNWSFNAAGNKVNVGNVLVSYATLKGALPASDKDLRANDPNPAGAAYSQDWGLPGAYARMLLGSTITPQANGFDDTVTLNTYLDTTTTPWAYGQDVINGVIHELSEGIMGRNSGLGKNAAWAPMDLFRYALPTTWLGGQLPSHDYSDGADGQTTYFSSDGVNLSNTVGLSFTNALNSDGTPNANNVGADVDDWNAHAVFGAGVDHETITLNQTELDVMKALGWKEALPQETFLAIQDDWQTPGAWADGFMPISVQDALIGLPFSSCTATSSANVQVNSIATSASSHLIITGNSSLTAINGTELNPNRTTTIGDGNLGTIDVDPGSSLHIGFRFDNVGTLTVGANRANVSGFVNFGSLYLESYVQLFGGGTLNLGQEGQTPFSYTTGHISGDGYGLTNVDNKINGGGSIFVASFDNQLYVDQFGNERVGVDANQFKTMLEIGASSSFTNEGIMQVEVASTLGLGGPFDTETLVNTHKINVYGNLAIVSNFTVSGSGATYLAGTGSAITSAGYHSTQFTNASNILASSISRIGDIGQQPRQRPELPQYG